MTLTQDPCHDPARLAALRAYRILDTPRETGFDNIVDLAARICRAPIAMINLLDDDRQWFKAETGLGVRELPLKHSNCRQFLSCPGLIVVPDTRVEPKLLGFPQIQGETGLRFYAGCALRTADGHRLGMLCVADYAPRPAGLDADQRIALEVLADQVMVQMDLRLALSQKSEALERQALLTRELHHRVRNSLQVVSSIIGLQQQGVTDPDAHDVLRTARDRVRAIAAVHDRLHRNDQAEDSVELDDFLGGLIDALRPVKPDCIALTFEAVPARLPIAAAMPLALIVNELVTNALKHAYPQGARCGTVAVRLDTLADGEERLRLTVTDRGCGVNPGARRNGSLGMQLIEALAQGLGAEFHLEDAAPGTRARRELPAPEAAGQPSG